MHTWVVTSSPPGRGRIVGGSCRRVPWSKAPGVVIVLANPFDHAQGVSLLCGSSRRCGSRSRGAQCAVLTRRGAEGADDGGHAWSRAVPCPRVVAHACQGSCRGESTKGRRYSSGAVSGLSSQRSEDPPCTRNSGTVLGAWRRDAGHVRCTVWWPTPSDAA